MVRAVEEEKLEIPSTESQNVNGWRLTRKETIRARNISKADDSASPTVNQNNAPSEMEQMKEKFAKLLLGEDMSGGGKGVSSALALSNAITNLAASAFGEQKRLEPMQPETKIKWRKEIDWLLSVTDHIVEFVASKQKAKDGTTMEIMITKQRTDLQMNIPALRKLDTMLLDCLDSFEDQSEISYTSQDEEGKNSRKDDKWWIPTPKVPPNGLSDATRKWLQFQKDSVNQVHKAALAINAQILTEMEVPENYIENLPKNGRASLGDSIYRSITDEYFDPDYFLSTMDLSSEHKILDLKNRIEASVIIWRRKMNAKDAKSAWSSAVSMEKREIFEERAETILLILKHRFPGIPQSSLDISKIQYNRDIGHAILESYSRIIESRAFTVMSRIEDVIQADNLAQDPSNGEVKRYPIEDPLKVSYGMNDKEDVEKLSSGDTPNSMTLLDFMGWEEGDDDAEKDMKEDQSKESDAKLVSKPPNVVTNNRVSYLDNLAGLRSPTARH
ncbi:rop guanine nucleotide exchange factor 12 isoform X1 [Capsicum annuum]|nr:rop guanine nucleotide exchange factor 12 isoform X1 [Capsicum annuum]XP_047266076.1 rop guanine nucleotide exchange factor 12 isoform X1 [Capsicum annuum]XP_047266077.1 rop guanine nucleotide exchange factor 12 isoform X1 [Capsicum annuum]